MRERLLVADSGPLIALAGISHLHLLPPLYSRIAAPLAVIAEIRAGEHLSPGHRFLDDIPWLECIESPQPPDSLSIVLGRGEAETIALARLHADSLLLLDDHQARRAAEALGLSITGTAGILVRAKKEGMVETVGPLLHKMREQGYFLSDAVIQYACRQAKEAAPVS